MRRPLLPLAVLAAAVLAGCGQTSSESSAEKFSGQQKAVAQVVEDLQDAGEGQDGERICNEILSPALVDQVKASGSDCAAEMKRSLEDADEYELDVQKVTVQGSGAEAEVKGTAGERSRTATMRFAKERSGWRVVDLGAGT